MPTDIHINNRIYHLNATQQDELYFEENKNYLFNLSYLGGIKFTGENTETFLQGQLTADCRKVNPTTIQNSALCNLKGRILALMDIIDWQGLKLILPHDLIEATITSLNKTALISRVRVEEESSFKIYGFYLNNANQLPKNIELPKTQLAAITNEKWLCYSLGTNRYIFLVKEDYIETFDASFAEKSESKGSLPWHYLNLKDEMVEIYPDTRGLFLPHRLNLHLKNYLSFDKGCYKGQEIIARTHYRATLKHGLEVFNIKTEEEILAGKKLVSLENSAEIGEIIDYCPVAKDEYLIAATMLLERPSAFAIEGSSKALVLEK